MSIVTDWSKYEPEFTRAEFACKHTGECEMTVEFMDALHRLRLHYGKPMRINSGYRSPRHPIEARKATPGAHALGIAADIGVSGADALHVVTIAAMHGFTGVGVSQRGDHNSRFIHLDMGHAPRFPRPTIYSY